MGYYVRALPWKKSDPRWKVQFVSYKSKDNNKREYGGLGHHVKLNFSELRQDRPLKTNHRTDKGINQYEQGKLSDIFLETKFDGHALFSEVEV